MLSLTPMQIPPVVVVLLSQFKIPVSQALRLVGCLALFFLGQSAIAQQVVQPQEQRYLAKVQLHTAEELESILQRADNSFTKGTLQSGTPVVFVLHGPEGKVFLREAYAANKNLVDLAARLSALDLVSIRVCETWMGFKGIEKAELLPFVETVPYGPKEKKRLLKEESYSYF